MLLLTVFELDTTAFRYAGTHMHVLNIYVCYRFVSLLISASISIRLPLDAIVYTL